MVITRLKMGYFVDHNIFNCVLHDDKEPTVKGSSITLTFVRRKTADYDEQREHMRKVFAHHNIDA